MMSRLTIVLAACVAVLLVVAPGSLWGQAHPRFIDDVQATQGEELPLEFLGDRKHVPEVLSEADRRAAIEERISRKLQKKIKDPYDQPHEAQEWYAIQRTGGVRPIDYKLLEKAKAERKQMAERSGEVLFWQELGPGNVGGRTRTVIASQADPDTMYAGGASGGVWTSPNGGGFWLPLDDLMDNLAVTSLCFAGHGTASENANIIYAGTGEGYFNTDAVRGAGIFKSTDAGISWFQLSNTANSDFFYVNKIVASPNSNDVLYAATRTGVWKTVNGGITWTQVLANNGTGGTSGTQVATSVGAIDLKIRTDENPDVLFASFGSFITDGIYRSEDAGSTWSRVFTTAGFGRASLAIAPSDQDYIYAMAADNANGHRLKNVYRSTNGGDNWTARIGGSFDQYDIAWLLLTNVRLATLSVCFSGATDVLAHQGWYDNILAVAPHDRDVLFAGGIDTFRSDNGGADWGILSYWWEQRDRFYYHHADIHEFLFHPDWNGTSNTTLYTGSDGGITRTTNALDDVASGPNDGLCIFTNINELVPDVAWQHRNHNYSTVQFYHGAAFPPGNSTYLGGMQDNGTWIGMDSTGEFGWSELIGGDGGYVAINPNDTNIRFGETTEKSLRRATNGLQFTAIATDAQLSEPSGNFAFIAPFRMHPLDPDIIHYGGQRPWRSNNASSAATPAAVTWSAIGTSFASRGVSDLAPEISAWAVESRAANYDAYAGLQDGRIFTETSNNFSASRVWTDFSNGLPTGSPGLRPFISWIEVDPNSNGSRVYATNSVFGFGHVFVRDSAVNPTTWVDISTTLPDIPVHCIRVQPGFPDNLFIGTDLGVFVSRNRGITWEPVNDDGNSGFTYANVVTEALEFQTASTLYAFSHGRGAYRAFVDTTVVTPTPTPTPIPTPFPTPTVSGIPDIGFDFNGVDIPNGGSFDFGFWASGSEIERTFNFRSEGSGQLFYPSGIVLTGPNSTQFEVTTQPAGVALAPGFNVPVRIEFQPTSLGTKTATAVIDTNDPDEDPFIFTLTGTAQSGSPLLSIADGLTPVGDNSTYVLGDTEVNDAEGVALTVRNTGTGTLFFTGEPHVIVNGSNAQDFDVQLAADSINPGGFGILTISFTPSAGGLRTARAIINCNDTNLTDSGFDPDSEPDYIINLQGTGTTTPDIIVKNNGGGFVEIPYGGSVEVATTAIGGMTSSFIGIGSVGSENIILEPVREERVLLEGANPDSWEIFYYPLDQVVTGPSSEVTGMRFVPATAGYHSAQVLIPSNDPDENPFVFTIAGFAVDLSDGLDSDKDGFSDAVEELYETDEQNDADKPPFGDYSEDGVTDLEDAVALGHATQGGSIAYNSDYDVDVDGDVDFTDAGILYLWAVNAATYEVIPRATPPRSLSGEDFSGLERLME